MPGSDRCRAADPRRSPPARRAPGSRGRRVTRSPRPVRRVLAPSYATPRASTPLLLDIAEEDPGARLVGCTGGTARSGQSHEQLLQLLNQHPLAVVTALDHPDHGAELTVCPLEARHRIGQQPGVHLHEANITPGGPA